MVKPLETHRKYVEYVPTEFGDLSHGSALTYQTLSTLVLSGNVPSLPLLPQPRNYSSVLPKELSDVYEGLKLSYDESLRLEEETMHQSTCKVWHEVRSECITAYNFKRACFRRSDFQCTASSLHKQKSIQTKEMKRGVKLEPVAATLYSEITGHQIIPCGFVLNANALHLGCTPDRTVSDLNADPCHGLLEIKCPNNASYRSCPYLIRKEDGSYSLKHGHEYHHQIMGQMGWTHAEWCDL